MARLRHPVRGTTITVDGRLADAYRARGWAPVDAIPPTSDTTCPVCGFVAKTAAGLGAHRRSH